MYLNDLVNALHEIILYQAKNNLKVITFKQILKQNQPKSLRNSNSEFQI
jgi:hypothetical protein